MLKDITLGQFFPGKTIIHRLDPRTKLLMLIVYIVALFLAKSWCSYGLVLAFLVAVTVLGKIPFKAMTKGLKPMLVFIIFTAVLNLFYTKSGTLLLDWWIFEIWSDGIITAFFMVMRIMMLVCGTFLLTYTTSPIALTDALEQPFAEFERGEKITAAEPGDRIGRMPGETGDTHHEEFIEIAAENGEKLGLFEQRDGGVRRFLQDAGVEREPRVVPEENGRVFLCRRSHDLPLTAAAAADQ